MTDNPYSPPTAEPISPESRLKAAANVMLALLKCAGSYLLGIFTCVIFTEAEFNLAGVNLLPAYLSMSVIGVGLWFMEAYRGLPSSPPGMWWVVLVLLIPCAGEVLVCFARQPRFRFLRPLWIGFPIGFIGPLGIYWTAALSI
jgi:hypothetical protein